MSKVKVKAKSVNLRGNYAPLSVTYSTSTDVIIEAEEIIVLPKLNDAGTDTGDTTIFTGAGAIIECEESITTFDTLISATDGSETT